MSNETKIDEIVAKIWECERWCFENPKALKEVGERLKAIRDDHYKKVKKVREG